MLDKRNGNGGMNGNMCMCPGCHYGGRGWTFFLLRALISIIILMIVFWFGVAAGRLGSGLEWGREYMMNGYYGSGGTGAVPMMRINGATSTPTTNGYPQNY